MSERYVWDKYGTKTQINESIRSATSGELYINSSSRRLRFRVATSYTVNSDGSISLQGAKTVELPSYTGGTVQRSYEPVSSYPYCAIYDVNSKAYNVPPILYCGNVGIAYWEFKYMGDGYTMYVGLVDSTTSAVNNYDVLAITPTQQTVSSGVRVGQASSAEPGTYPNGGVSGSNWYVFKGSDSIDPLGVGYSADRLEKGKPVTVEINAPGNTLGGTVSYQYQYSIDGGKSWTSAGNATTGIKKEITIPENAEQFMARVRAQDDIGFVSNDYVSGPNLTVRTMRLWAGVDGKARQGKELPVGIDSKARPAVHAWVGDGGGKARRFL